MSSTPYAYEELVLPLLKHLWFSRIVRVLALLAVFPLCAVVAFVILLVRSPEGGPTMALVNVTRIPRTDSLLSGTDYATVRDGTLYIAYSSAGTLLAMDTRTHGLRSYAADLPGLHGVAFSDKPADAFVSVGDANEVVVFDASTASRLINIPAGKGPDGIIFDTKADLAYAGSGASKSATLIPAQDVDQAYTIPLGGAPEFPQSDSASGLIYQPLTDTSEVVVVDPSQRAVVRRFGIAPCKNPTGSAIDTAGRVLLLGCSNRVLAVMSLDDGHILTTVPIGRFVDTVAWDPDLHRAYTANVTSMTVVGETSPGNYAVLDTVRTRLGAHTLAIDPRTHRVYVICSGIRSGSIFTYEPRAEGK